MNETEFKEYLIGHLIEKVGLSKNNAIRESDSMMEGKKQVIEGDYSYFTDINNQNIFYRRDNNNTWVHEKDMDGMSLSKALFCNLKKSCLLINNNCGNILINKEQIKQQLINEMLQRFEGEIAISNDNLIKQMKSNLENALLKIKRLSDIKIIESNKNDILKKIIGDTLKEENVIVSKYSYLKDLILSDSDFINKQTNILFLLSLNYIIQI